MIFIDNLAYSLFAISFAGFMLLYASAAMYVVYRKHRKNFYEHLKSASMPLAAIGVYLFITGLWGQLAWPLPGSYNMLFYDPMISFGILLIAFTLAVKFNIRFECIGFFGMLVGVMVMVYGIEGYRIGLTSSPLALMGMYLLYGLAGVFSYPVSLIADWLLKPKPKTDVWEKWHLLLVIFLVLLLLASVLSAFIAIATIPTHLITPP